jgi:plastocyanin
MRQLRTIAGAMLFTLLLVPAGRAQMMDQVVPGEVRVFQVTLRHKGAAAGFTPFLVIVRPQDKVRFVVTSVDSDCSFELKGLHIEQQLKKGVPSTINFSAPDEGKFEYICASNLVKHHMHRDIKGTLVVKQASKGAETAAYGTPAQ